MPYIGRSTDGFGVRNRFLYLASASDTSVSGADANGATLTFTDGAYVDVYLNGVLLKAGTDYNTNTANTIAGLASMAANDEVTVIVYDIFAVADTVSQSSGGTFSGAITFSSTVSGLDVNGTEIILDADGDTTITADTDDQIDIKIAGQDDFQFTANTFTAQSGSTIAAQALTATTITATGDISFDGGDFVFNESGAAKDFRIEGDTFSNLFIVDGSEDDIGMGLTPSFTSGNGVHLADDFKIGFGAGGSSRPDFQLGYTSSTDRLSLACGYGADDADVQITTGGQIGLGTVGSGAISHNIQIKDNAPEIMMEETGSGGSKRISIGVESDGTPFISAEQSGGQVEVQLAGNPEFQFLNGGRFRVTRTGVPAYISRGPVTGVTVDHGSTTSVAGLSGVLHNIVMVSTGGGYGATFAMSYHSTVTKLVGTGNFSASSGTSSSTNVYKSSASHAVTLQNNTGAAVSYYILILSSYD